MDAKETARRACDEARAGLITLSHRIHANPETGYREEKAAAWLSDFLESAGFDVARGICDTPTAFCGRAGAGALRIAFLAEYDALPDIGHACGHNIIATAAAGAGIAAASVAGDLDMTVLVIGTPAEEVGDDSGKIRLLDRGAFDGVHAAMMVHPAPLDLANPKMLAAASFEVRYTGKEAHASVFPERGINAADALTVAQTAIGLLRQHILPTDRIHGIITKGGEAPNIVPAETAARYMIRSETIGDLARLRDKVYRCFEAGALATGAKVEIVSGDKPYAEVRHDAAMVELYRENAESLGRVFPDLGGLAERFAGSTDMGNVSLVIPSIHPAIGIDSLPAVNHQPEFTTHCISEAADRAVYDGALAMAWTAIDMAGDPAMRARLMKVK